jgi:hypothetical protein
MLMLPSGQLLMNLGGNDLWAYTPNEAANSSWLPTISSVKALTGGNFMLKGTQLTGMSEGASYGDDAEMSENYPIVRLTDSSSNVYYARTYGWSSVGVQTGSATVTTRFQVPAGIPAGSYSLQVIANGIASTPFGITLAADQLDSAGLGVDLARSTTPTNASSAKPVEASSFSTTATRDSQSVTPLAGWVGAQWSVSHGNDMETAVGSASPIGHRDSDRALTWAALDALWASELASQL